MKFSQLMLIITATFTCCSPALKAAVSSAELQLTSYLYIEYSDLTDVGPFFSNSDFDSLDVTTERRVKGINNAGILQGIYQDTKVVIKVLPQMYSTFVELMNTNPDSDDVYQVTNEITWLARLEINQLGPVFFGFTVTPDDHLALVQEKIVGTELYRYQKSSINNKKKFKEELARIAKKLSDLGLVLVPDLQLMITTDESVKVIDPGGFNYFGSCRTKADFLGVLEEGQGLFSNFKLRSQFRSIEQTLGL